MPELEFHFDEMKILGEGLLAYGTATLVDAGEDYEGEWYVERIVLVDGTVLKERGNGYLGLGDKFLDVLFASIASQIQNDKCPIGRAAAGEWADFLDGNAPAPVVPALRPRRGMPLMFSDSVRGASLEVGR